MVRVVEPGLQTTIQDLGRPGLGDQGISPAGPMDALSFRLGNLIVGNPPTAAGLEITLVGPTLAFDTEAVIALAGAPFEAYVIRRPTPLPLWRAVMVRPGDILKLGPARAGSRAYLCVAGGIDVPPIFGSRATHLMAGLGGLDGRALKAGDRLAIGQPILPLSRLAGRRLKQTAQPTFPSEAPVRVILGPQTNRFTEAAQATFLSQPYTVSTDSNRMGVRLTGPVVAHTQGADLLSEGIGLGAIQVPQNGQPIILMVDRQTTGGYTKIATVISADIRRVGQARPGSKLRFQAVTAEAAVTELQTQEALVDETFIERGETWGVAEVTTLIQAFTASGLAEMEVEAGGVRLVLRRERGSGEAGEQGSGGEREKGGRGERGQGSGGEREQGERITAPLLGIFYAAPSPDAPPFVHPGDEVEAGQAVALIDVMKTLHQVHAPQAGVIEAILVENGTLVEYGQTLMTLAPIH